MNSHRYKTVQNKSSRVQWHGGIPHPQESQREGKNNGKNILEQFYTRGKYVSTFFFF